MPTMLLTRIMGKRRNLIANSEMGGAVVGSPGTLPRGWASFYPDSAKGVTIQVAALGVENGLNYIDIRASGTATSTPNGSSNVFFTAGNAIPMLPGDRYTLSYYARISAGTFPSWLLLVPNELDAAQGYLRNDFLGPSFTSTLDRYSLTTYVQNASCRYVQPGISIGYPTGTAFDVTLRFAGVQLERGAWASSYERRAA